MRWRCRRRRGSRGVSWRWCMLWRRCCRRSGSKVACWRGCRLMRWQCICRSGSRGVCWRWCRLLRWRCRRRSGSGVACWLLSLYNFTISIASEGAFVRFALDGRTHGGHAFVAINATASLSILLGSINHNRVEAVFCAA